MAAKRPGPQPETPGDPVKSVPLGLNRKLVTRLDRAARRKKISRSRLAREILKAWLDSQAG